MKKYLSILSALLLGSCSEAPIEELPAIPEGPAASGVVFTVEAAGYTTDNPDSRAVDSGYETTFVAGDRIGLFCYDAEGGLLGDNGILTYDGRIWSGEIDPAGAARLIAYYPYEEQFAGGIRQTSDFFSFGWITDQSTPEKYTAADQMVCETEYDGVSPSIALHMQRQRSMIEFRIASDAVLAEATTTINNYTCTYKPYRVEAGVYRILTPERSSGIRITATILDGNIEKTYAINQATLTLGKYNTYRINYTATTKIPLDGTRSLADMLTEQFGEGYDPASITALQLSGPLTAADWSTLKELTGLATADLKGVTAPEIPAQQFQNFSALTTVVLPERLETIGSWAFSGSSIRKIELPETLTTIGDRAFRGVATLATVVIPASVREIRTAAFENMTALTSVTFEEGSQLSAIGDWAFAGDTRLTT
ncbi:MAG: leucine-rich repeat protein, partial [Alistipes sp.]|nr:leucine-rich repeat protein [Alistipes sp.]